MQEHFIKNDEIRYCTIILIGFMIPIGIVYFPFLISQFNNSFTTEIGGLNLSVVFILSAPYIGLKIGDLVNPQDSQDEKGNSKDFGYIFIGIFIGMTIIFIYSILTNTNNSLVFYTGIATFFFLLLTFLIKITDLIKSKKQWEEKINETMEIFSLIGLYEFLYTTYLLPLHVSMSDPFFQLIYYFILSILTISFLLLFVKNTRKIIPEKYVIFISNRLFEKNNSNNKNINEEEKKDE